MPALHNSASSSLPRAPRPQDYVASMDTMQPTRQTRSFDMLGDYILLRSLATGGMAEIYLGRNIHSNELAVIKRIHRASESEADMVQMFLDEAAITCALNHENLPQVLDLGCSGTSHFIALEYLRGVDIVQLLRRLNSCKRGLPQQVVLALIIGACRGLQHAHERVNEKGEALGIVHRDISPQNLFVTYEGVVKVLDFGIARSTARMAMTNPGSVKGKARYMSPEQCQAGETDQRSDIFSLCIILWELVTGKPLYRGGHELAVMSSIVSKDAPRPRSVLHSVPAELEAIIMRGLNRNPRKRYQSASELEAALVGYAESRGADISQEGVAAFLQSLYAQETGIDQLDAALVTEAPCPELVQPDPDCTEVIRAGYPGDATILELPAFFPAPSRLRLLCAFACGLLLALIVALPAEESDATTLEAQLYSSAPAPEGASAAAGICELKSEAAVPVVRAPPSAEQKAREVLIQVPVSAPGCTDYQEGGCASPSARPELTQVVQASNRKARASKGRRWKQRRARRAQARKRWKSARQGKRGPASNSAHILAL